MDDRKLSDALENLTQRISLLNEVFAMREPFLVKNLNFAQRLTLHKQKGESFYKVIQIPLDAATENYMEAISGQLFYINRIYTRSTGVDAAGSIRCKFFRNDQQHTIGLFGGQGVVTPFDRVYMGWDAQAGVTAEIIVSEDFDLFRIVDNRLATSITSITTVASVTDVAKISSIPGLISLPSGATEVYAREELNNENTKTVYTVTSGKTLHILESYLSLHNSAASLSAIMFAIHNGTTHIGFFHALGRQSGTGVHNSSRSHMPHIEVAAGYTIRMIGGAESDITSLTAAYGGGVIRGYEI